ncbi:MAG: stalk domain-containing protein [Defluviitaleaceae bacterium]|nr:stalk domain-containing protein [Defluviitaleaceae bacterium]
MKNCKKLALFLALAMIATLVPPSLVSSTFEGGIASTVYASTTPASITISDGGFTLSPGATRSLSVSVDAQGTSLTGLTWHSSNWNVASVSLGGVVTARAHGSTTITATATFANGTVSSSSIIVSVGTSGNWWGGGHRWWDGFQWRYDGWWGGHGHRWWDGFQWRTGHYHRAWDGTRWVYDTSIWWDGHEWRSTNHRWWDGARWRYDSSGHHHRWWDGSRWVYDTSVWWDGFQWRSTNNQRWWDGVQWRDGGNRWWDGTRWVYGTDNRWWGQTTPLRTVHAGPVIALAEDADTSAPGEEALGMGGALPTEGTALRFTIGSIFMRGNGEVIELEAPPFIDRQTNRAMIPLRAVAEGLGAGIDWDAETRIARIERDETVITLSADQALPGGMGTPIVIDDRIFVPVRYVSEVLGETVRWDARNMAVYVN